MKRLTTEQFIERATEVHNGKYDYSKVEYKNAQTKVVIICPIHGEFLQSAYGHLEGRGCPICGIESSKKKQAHTKDEFVMNAIKVHGDKYDYSRINYINNYTKVCIVCPEHGEFWQSPSHHLQGSGCPLCGEGKRHISRRTQQSRIGIVMTKENICNEKSYSVWKDMLRRCYNRGNSKGWASYIGCTICSEWLVYDNFKQWFDDNYIENWALDKDLLVKGNREYSPDKCCFLPSELNGYFKRYTKRNSVLPFGVKKQGNKYYVETQLLGKRKYLGSFDTIEDASQAYITQKYKDALFLAEKWKEELPKNVYNAILNYKFDV